MPRRVIAFTYKSNKEVEERVRKWLSLLEHPYELYNIPQNRPEKTIKKGDVVITFGKVVSSLINQSLDDRGRCGELVVELPKPDSLKRKKENSKEREQSREKLLELKKILEEDRFQPAEVTITDEDLPALDKQHIAILKELTEEEEKTSCFQTTQNGKLIEISTAPLEESKADIHITFSELYIIRQVMDVLKVDEVQIVKHSKNNTG